MTDAFEEVEEKIREERLASLWKKAAPWLIGGFAAILAGVGGYEAWKHFSAQASAALTVELRDAQALADKGDFKAAEAAFAAVAKKASGGVRQVALMQQAGAQVGQGELQDAISTFDAAAAAFDGAPETRDAARLKAAYLAADSQELKVVEPRIRTLIDGGGPYALLARELLAMEALEAGELEKARIELDVIVLALDAPEGVRQRAQSALALIGPKAVPAAAAPAASAAPAPAATPAKTN